MAEITLKEAIPTNTPMIIEGRGLLAAQALCQAGHGDTLATIITPDNGSPSIAQTAVDLTRLPDPVLSLKAPQASQNFGAPEFNSGPSPS